MDFTRARPSVGGADRAYRGGMALRRPSPRPGARPRVGPAGRAGCAVLGLALLLGGCAAGTIDAQDGDLLAEGLAGAPRTPAPAPADAAEQAERAATAAPDLTTLAAGPDDGAGTEPGDLVPGFPEDLLPLPDDAVILVTSAEPVGSSDVQEVSLNLRTALTPAAVVTLYRDSLTAAGFTEVELTTPRGDLAAEATFTRSGGDELVSIGVLDVDGLRTVTLGGRVHGPA